MAPEILRCPYKSKPEENKEKEHLHYGEGRVEREGGADRAHRGAAGGTSAPQPAGLM